MKKNVFAAALMACVMTAALAAAPTVRAEGEGEWQAIDSVQIKKYLVLQKGVPVPDVTFGYTLAPGQAVEGTENTHGILAGPDGAVFSPSGKVSFSSSDAVTAEASAPSDITVQFATTDTSDEAYAEKTLTVDLSGVTFTGPGIYRYVITETQSDMAGIVPDSVNKRYLDVYVQKADQSDDFVPAAVILRADDGAPDKEGNSDPGVKSTGFTNRYSTGSIGFAKSVTGNQASLNQYFKFTVKLTGGSTVDETTRVKVSGAFDAKPAENMATRYDAAEMAQANDGVEYVTLSQLRAGKDFYIKDGQSVLLTGIPSGMGYEVAEIPEDYTSSVEVQGDEECTPADSKVTDASLTEDTTLHFVNTRNGIIPSTGVSAAFAVPAAVMLAGMAGLVLMFVRRMKKKSGKETN